MASGIFYDKDQWAEAGLTEEDIPKTWDQLIAVAQKLTKVDDNGKMTVAGFGFNGNISFLLEIPAIRSFKPISQHGPKSQPGTIRIKSGDEGIHLDLGFDFRKKQ